jgi:hypothetical protein
MKSEGADEQQPESRGPLHPIRTFASDRARSALGHFGRLWHLRMSGSGVNPDMLVRGDDATRGVIQAPKLGGELCGRLSRRKLSALRHVGG